APGGAPADLEAGTAPAGVRQSGAAKSDTVRAGTPPVDAVGGTGAPGTEGNDTRRTRRSTSAGTAFATAVLVEDSPALVPVVPPAADQAPAAFVPAAPGHPPPAEPPAPSAPPVRRPRAGSAVARVTVVTEPEPAAPDAAPQQPAAG